MSKRSLLVVVAAALLAGCWPYRFTDRPGISGTVVAGADGSPVSGAAVTLVLPHGSAANEEVSVTTDQRGVFEIPAQRSWSIFIPMAHTFAVDSSIKVASPGFKTEVKGLRWSANGPAMTKLGVIKLEHAQ